MLLILTDTLDDLRRGRNEKRVWSRGRKGGSEGNL